MSRRSSISCLTSKIKKMVRKEASCVVMVPNWLTNAAKMEATFGDFTQYYHEHDNCWRTKCDVEAERDTIGFSGGPTLDCFSIF